MKWQLLLGIWTLTYLGHLAGCTVEVVYPGDGVPRSPAIVSDTDGGVGDDKGPDGVEELISTEVVVRGVAPFEIKDVSPNTGPAEGGTRVTLLGAQFEDVIEVYFGNQPAASWVSLGPEAIRADSPSGSPGLVPVSVVRADGTQATLEGAFRYLSDVVVSKVIPAEGEPHGGTLFELHGQGFEPSMNVLFEGRQALSIQWVDSTRVVGVSPWGLPGFADIIVSTGNQFDRLKDGFLYRTPIELTSVFPPSVPTAGGG